MSDETKPAPVEGRALLHSVARLHYESDLSQVEIARKLGLSTATISRLLRRARTEGVVRIEVMPFVSPDHLGAELATRLSLAAVRVIDAPANALPAALAAPLAEILTEAALAPGAAVALGWGRAIRAVLGAGLPPMPGVLLVPATGGLQQHEPHFQINEFVREAAVQVGGVPHLLHAPNLPAAGTRQHFLSDPAIAATVALWDRLEIAILGVGASHGDTPAEATVATTAAEQRLVHAAGDVIRHYFDRCGKIIDWDGEARLIAVSHTQLSRARLSIGVASGPAKAAPLIGAARAGLINAVVTDTQTALAMLDRLGSASTGSGPNEG